MYPTPSQPGGTDGLGALYARDRSQGEARTDVVKHRLFRWSTMGTNPSDNTCTCSWSLLGPPYLSERKNPSFYYEHSKGQREPGQKATVLCLVHEEAAMPTQ